MNEYIKLVPKPVLEEPYELSMISLYDANFNEIWYHEDINSPNQDHDKAQVRINEIWKFQNEKYVQWSIPQQINLDLSEVYDHEATIEEISTEHRDQKKEDYE